MIEKNQRKQNRAIRRDSVSVNGLYWLELSLLRTQILKLKFKINKLRRKFFKVCGFFCKNTAAATAQKRKKNG